MQFTERSGRSWDPRVAEIYYGYCNRTQRFRMMDLEDFLDNMREGCERMWGEAQSWPREWQRGSKCRCHETSRKDHHCGCCEPCDCHCECCVCDADVLVHARCGERRRISLTFENDTRRERDVQLTLGPFSTAGGTTLGWAAKLSEEQFHLGPCDRRTVLLDVTVDCAQLLPGSDPNTDSAAPRGPRTVDRCIVAYATVRAEGCLTRPIVVAVAVLPDDCDAYDAHCGCNCC